MVEVAVIALPDERWIEAVTAVVVAKSEVTESELVEHLWGSLSNYKVPKWVHLTEELPRNASGKLLKRVLRDQLT